MKHFLKTERHKFDGNKEILININHIKKISSYIDGSILDMIDGTSITICLSFNELTELLTKGKNNETNIRNL